MGDFSARDLWGVDHVDAVDSETLCAGCGGQINEDDRCYGDGPRIWHARCWPSTAALDAREAGS